MKYSQVQGNEVLKKTFAGMIRSGHIPHAILLHEDDGGGGIPLALAFLQDLYCHERAEADSCGLCPNCNKMEKLIHPDVHFVFPVTAATPCIGLLPEWRKLVLENPQFTEADLQVALGIEGKATLINVAAAKNILETLSLSALEGGYSSIVIYLPEKMNTEAANRLLKIIEEPSELIQFVLVTHAPEKVLPTIRSRCQQFRLEPLRGGAGLQFSDPGLFDALMDALLARDLSAALEASEAVASLPSRDALKTFCRYASGRFRELFLLQQGLDALSAGEDRLRDWASRCRKTFPRKALEATDRCLRQIERNVNAKIAFADFADRLYMNV
ncbi:MAG: hypothetical protein IJV01_03730 [Bacteroidales bacterium]|nr:hypothetical protein [Bacteroidales bacterium]